MPSNACTSIEHWRDNASQLPLSAVRPATTLRYTTNLPSWVVTERFNSVPLWLVGLLRTDLSATCRLLTRNESQ